MMRLLNLLVGSVPMYSVIAVLNNILIVLGTVLATVMIFNVRPKKNTLVYIFSFLTVAVCTALEVYDTVSGSESGIISSIVLLMPFICILLLFPIKAAWKGFIVAFGYNLIEAAKYIILMLFFEYDSEQGNVGEELFADTVVNIITFIVILGFFIRHSRKHRSESIVAKINFTLYFLIIATTVVFVTTMIILGINYSQGRKLEFAITFLNIPFFGVTVAYAMSSVLRSRLSEENYRKQLDMQVRHYEMLEKKNEEMRVFRHDLPKKLRPLGAYISDGRIEDAQKILTDFNISVENTRPRYQSGNFRLDTVLECQQQIAEKENIDIVFPFDCAFPESGIEPDDIYTIFPNALDNAIEACRKVGGKCEITVISHIRGDTVFITVRNPVAGKPVIKNGALETTKADKENHGYGFRSIKKAAAKYGTDNVDYSVEDGMFVLRMDLKFMGNEKLNEAVTAK